MNSTILKKISAPGVLLMSRFRYPQKFLIISILFAVPIALGLYSFIENTNTEIETVQIEQKGISYLIPMQVLLRDMQQHRGLTGALLSGDTSFKQTLLEKRDEIDQAFIELEHIDTKEGIYLKEGGEPARVREIKDGWIDIKQKFDKNILTMETSFRAHTTLIQDIIFFIGYIGDNSNLTLDRHLSTSYLIDAFINRVPIITESMGQLRASGLIIPTGKRLSQGEKQFFLSLSSTADSNIKKLNTRMSVVFEEDYEVQSKLVTPLKDATEGVLTLVSIVDKKIIQTDTNTLSREEYYTVSTQAIDSVFSFYNNAVPVLNTLLQDRINALNTKRDILFVSVGVSLALVVYLFVGFYLGVKETIEILRQATSKMLKNTQNENIILNTKDEFSEIVNSFNIIINAFTVANTNLKDTLAKKETTEQELRKRTDEIDGFNQLMVGRELKMMELKEEITALKKQAGERSQ